MSDNSAQEATDIDVSKLTPLSRRSRLTRVIWGIVGFIAFLLGAAGAVLPLLPTTPFIILAAFCFARSTGRLEAWFQDTKLNRMMQENYLNNRGLTWRKKLEILASITILMGIGFYVARPFPTLQVIIGIVWFLHLVFFGLIKKTVPTPEDIERKKQRKAFKQAAKAKRASNHRIFK
ncbi:YbaN family protein [Collinsella sp. zg1085]|uniref:YbaN family protein n=1 Tax=Collinsella sp. zg1085 TaxID=2844380 RepID=UPI001C0B6FBE|nr:YbaN family protein [Collinsella sp. zg1085]QWT17892.1 YbaN family protein [Collinsella sp. zg1085]